MSRRGFFLLALVRCVERLVAPVELCQCLCSLYLAFGATFGEQSRPTSVVGLLLEQLSAVACGLLAMYVHCVLHLMQDGRSRDRIEEVGLMYFSYWPEPEL